MPRWLPKFHPTYTAEQLATRLLKEDGVVPPAIDKEFYFYHTDLSPTNIFVVGPIPDDKSELPLLTAIIDWEAAGYYPRWWISTKPCVNAAYRLNWKVHPHPEAWPEVFADVLIEKGFQEELDWYWAYKDAWKKKRGHR